MDRWNYAFDYLPDPVIFFDRSLRIDRLNPAAESFALTSQHPTLLGLDCEQALHEYVVPRAACPVCRVRRGRNPIEWVGMAPNPFLQANLWSLTAIPVHDTPSGGIVLVMKRLASMTTQIERSSDLATIGLFRALNEWEIPSHVVDLTSKEVIWANETKQRRYGRGIVGQTCYAALRGLDEPCADCPSKDLVGEDGFRQVATRFQQDRLTGDWYLFLSRAFLWPDGRPVVLELAVDVFDVPTNESPGPQRDV